MNIKNITKFKIDRSAAEIYEAFVDPNKICNFWFSGSSCRWEAGKIVRLKYIEYGVIDGFDIKVTEANPTTNISFLWGSPGEENTVTINFKVLDDAKTIVEVIESGFNESDPNLITKLVDNKEGWVYMLTCLKAYMENNINSLRVGLIHE